MNTATTDAGSKQGSRRLLDMVPLLWNVPRQRGGRSLRSPQARCPFRSSLAGSLPLQALIEKDELPTCSGCDYLTGMSPAPKKKKTTAAELRTWRVSILRGRANHLGDVQAPDAKTSASLSYQRQIVFFAIASPFLFERHQHHLSLQHVPGLKTRMRVTARLRLARFRQCRSLFRSCCPEPQIFDSRSVGSSRAAAARCQNSNGKSLHHKLLPLFATVGQKSAQAQGYSVHERCLHNEGGKRCSRS